jgi:hypothetical protein
VEANCCFGLWLGIGGNRAEDVGLVYTPIPSRYENSDSTDLRLTVERGKQSHDVKFSAK